MPEAPQTLDGWFVLHDFRTIDWPAWKAADEAERQAALDELHTLIGDMDTVNANRTGLFGLYSIAGHKADLLFLHMGPTVEGLIEAKTRLNKTALGDYLQADYSYVSVVELGGYLAKPGVDPETDPYLVSRLKPELPEMSQVCFYPMNKKREGNDNWYMLSAEERRDLMRDHGMLGRKYAGVVKQIISGSMGLDDWEWGVTLFSDDSLAFKKLVYEMRFDETSARFAEFGPFLVGHRIQAEQAADLLTV